MSVELRCPECRTKLRLKDAPEPGTDVECPKCGHAFPAPDAGDAPKPAKKPAATAAGTNSVPLKAAPRKRKAKVYKANKKLLAAVIVGSLFVLGSIVGALVWFMGRKSVAMELCTYLPDDASSAVGANVGHAQKYPEVFKMVEPTYANLPFKKAADTVAAAFGTEGREWLAYAVTGTNKSGAVTVAMRSKKEFDPSALSKLPNAREASADGGRYYTASVDGVGSARVFAPTNRIVVVSSGSVPQASFAAMLGGNKDNPKAFHERMGTLGKRMSKGTLWSIDLFETAPKAETEAGGALGFNDMGKSAFGKLQNDIMNGSQGLGFKASLGSRAVRIEFAFTCRDKEAASNLSKKYNESVWTKGDDEEPPREWKYMRQQFGDQKIAREIYSNIGFTSSGNVFAAYSECDTKVLIQHMAGLLSKLTGANQYANPGGGVPNGGGPPPGMNMGGSGPPKQP
jgi:hypothetical protein